MQEDNWNNKRRNGIISGTDVTYNYNLNPDGSGYICGSDGTWGQINSNGNIFISDPNGGSKQIFSTGQGNYLSSDGNFIRMDNNGFIFDSNGGYGHINSTGNGYFYNSNGGLGFDNIFNSNYEDYSEENLKNDNINQTKKYYEKSYLANDSKSYEKLNVVDLDKVDDELKQINIPSKMSLLKKIKYYFLKLFWGL